MGFATKSRKFDIRSLWLTQGIKSPSLIFFFNVTNSYVHLLLQIFHHTYGLSQLHIRQVIQLDTLLHRIDPILNFRQTSVPILNFPHCFLNFFIGSISPIIIPLDLTIQLLTFISNPLGFNSRFHLRSLSLCGWTQTFWSWGWWWSCHWIRNCLCSCWSNYLINSASMIAIFVLSINNTLLPFIDCTRVHGCFVGDCHVPDRLRQGCQGIRDFLTQTLVVFSNIHWIHSWWVMSSD